MSAALYLYDRINFKTTDFPPITAAEIIFRFLKHLMNGDIRLKSIAALTIANSPKLAAQYTIRASNFDSSSSTSIIGLLSKY